MKLKKTCMTTTKNGIQLFQVNNWIAKNQGRLIQFSKKDKDSFVSVSECWAPWG